MQKSPVREIFVTCCGGRNCTHDLKVMSLASYYCSTPLAQCTIKTTLKQRGNGEVSRLSGDSKNYFYHDKYDK